MRAFAKSLSTSPVGIYLLKVNNRNTYFTPCSSNSVVNFEQVNAH